MLENDPEAPPAPDETEESNKFQNYEFEVQPGESLNILLSPNGPIPVDEPTLRELVRTGLVRQVGPSIQKDDKLIVIDFIKHFYPKDPDGAKRYFDAEHNSKNDNL